MIVAVVPYNRLLLCPIETCGRTYPLTCIVSPPRCGQWGCRTVDMTDGQSGDMLSFHLSRTRFSHSKGAPFVVLGYIYHQRVRTAYRCLWISNSSTYLSLLRVVRGVVFEAITRSKGVGIAGVSGQNMCVVYFCGPVTCRAWVPSVLCASCYFFCCSSFHLEIVRCTYLYPAFLWSVNVVQNNVEQRVQRATIRPVYRQATFWDSDAVEEE